jgi:type III pantothenate kinase
MEEDRLLLALDVGNTHTVLGVFHNKNLLGHWRISTERERTVDEYGMAIRGLLSLARIDHGKVGGFVASCVVPPLIPIVERVARRYFDLEAIMVEPGVKTGMPILYDKPQEVGADRIVNGVAAFAKYGGPAIIVDFGTATTFDAISAQGEYLGGAIAPGIMISAEALFQKAARLPRVEIRRPDAIIGKSTVVSMQSGLYYGYVGLVEGILQRMKKEMGRSTRVVATGGLSTIFSPETHMIDHVDPDLTLEGLRIIYERNQSKV